MEDIASGGIDCDIHPALPGISCLIPHLDDYWREQVRIRGIDGLDLASFPHAIQANCRADWRPEQGKPGGTLEAIRAQALDAFGSRIAICNPLYGVQALTNPHFATALARALNDWMAAEFLDIEPRLRASIIVATQDPHAAAEEIERRASDPRFVQVMVLVMGEAPIGQRQYWPILEAAERHGLPLAIHAGTIARHATTANGWPSYHMEDYASCAQAFQSQLLSLVHDGAFAKFPALDVVLMESGITWMPNFLWRAYKTWRGVRAEVPWVDRAPAKIIRERVRVTLQPADAPPDAAGMERLLDQLDGDHMLLFSTDYPHWHFDGLDAFPPGFSPALRRKMLIDNPLATYKRLQEVMA